MTSARPWLTASTVEKRWKTRIGSSELSTVTALPRWMRLVRAAIAASTTSGAEIAKSSRWCSPTPKKSSPSSSASTASSTTLRITCAWLTAVPSGVTVTSPNVSTPSSTVLLCSAIMLLSMQTHGREHRALGQHSHDGAAHFEPCGNLRGWMP
jgi:hypothetical protein